MVKPLDIVVAGPDGSGTSTQIKDLLDFFRTNGFKVKDLRGSEVDVLWHASENPVRAYARDFETLEQFTKKIEVLGETKQTFEGISLREVRSKLELLKEYEDVEATFLRWSARRIRETPNLNRSLATMFDVKHGTLIEPKDADLWVNEEPPHRLSGLHNRYFEQNRSAFHADQNHRAAASAHGLYREPEYRRFRGPVLDAGLPMLRSRSEESGIYQIQDMKYIPTGPTMGEFVSLPGHEIAFKYTPTHIFVAHAHADWSVEDYIKHKKERMKGRLTDDYENDAAYQVYVNHRYATDFLERLYAAGTAIHGGKMPKIVRFNMLEKPEVIREQMVAALKEIYLDAGYHLKAA